METTESDAVQNGSTTNINTNTTAVQIIIDFPNIYRVVSYYLYLFADYYYIVLYQYEKLTLLV
jgi:hypothetical protein